MTITPEDGYEEEYIYWQYADYLTNKPYNGKESLCSDPIAELECLLNDSLKIQSFSDVPLGAFLSGGIDSSVLVALLQKQSSKPIETFSIGFNEMLFDEAKHAKKIAKYLGTNHNELIIGPKSAMDMITKVNQAYDEPFSDSSQIPTMIVSEFARRKVKVALTGDGADELFGGYNRYKFCSNVWRRIGIYPHFARSLLSKIILSIPRSNWSKIINIILMSKNGHDWGRLLYKGADVITARDISEVYKYLVSTWRNPENVMVDFESLVDPIEKYGNKLKDLQPTEKLMAVDVLTYLLDDILVKVDRAAMNFSLETRAPFLDHRVVEFAAGLPFEMKINKETKWILRQILKKHLPTHLFTRPKMGFGIPIGDWLKGPLASWANDILSKKNIEESGLFHFDTIDSIWSEHKNGVKDNQNRLWNIMMFQTWYDNYNSRY